jgi:hypothetical protein
MDEPYIRLKEGLLQQHSMTKYQRIEWLHTVGGLGSRRPTQLVAEMMELCPDNEDASYFLVFPVSPVPPCLAEGTARGR